MPGIIGDGRLDTTPTELPGRIDESEITLSLSKQLVGPPECIGRLLVHRIDILGIQLQRTTLALYAILSPLGVKGGQGGYTCLP